MGSLGIEADNQLVIGKKKAMWMYPKVMGTANPSERWGHSSCFFNGLLYIFGGCRGGIHFSDVLMCNLETMNWIVLKTFGQGPGPRDSHSAVLVGHKMLVFGGTNGSKKVNDLHALDLVTREWTRPECHGNLPCPRESHTANALNDDKLIVFGGSGEEKGNYLNDLHILDLKTMEWSSPEQRGNIPAPRDSHSSVAVGNRLFVFGGDSGDRYQGDVSMLDLHTLVWSKLDINGPSPGPRAGHASVSVGTKVCVLGGVGDKKYYNDIWMLDVISSSWVQLEVCSQKSQGRFSHTATVTNLGIAIFGGCGEDERPLNELLFLQVDSLQCRASRYTSKEENTSRTIFISEDEDLRSKDIQELEFITKESFRFSSDMLHPKRRRTSNSNVALDLKVEPEEHLQHSSPSGSDHEQTPLKKSNSPYPSSRVHPLFRQRPSSSPSNGPLNRASFDPQETHIPPQPSLPMETRKFQNLIGAEVHGQVDGAFDSGYLMTATVNGKVFRGVLFAPGPEIVAKGGPTQDQQHPSSSFTHQIPVNHHSNGVRNHFNVACPRNSMKRVKMLEKGVGSGQCSRITQSTSPPENRAHLSLGREPMVKSELQGVVLTLAPGSDFGRP